MAWAASARITKDCYINERVTNEEVRIKTSCIGKPLLVKFSYFPNWQGNTLKLSIIVPACNEEKNIKFTLQNLSKLADETIVVCNGCTDSTSEIVRSMGIKLLELKQRNKGRAVLEGFKVATGDRIGFVDADGAFAAADIARVIDGLANSDCVTASKWKGQSFSSAPGSLSRKLASRVWNFFVRHMFGLSFSDTQAGLKFLTRQAFDSIGTNFTCNGFAFDVELLYKISKAGFKIKEIYTPVANSEGTFSMVSAPGMFASLVRLWTKSKL